MKYEATEIRVLEAHFIADALAMMDASELENRKSHKVREEAELVGFLLVVLVGICCMFFGLVGPAPDMIMVAPNAGLLAYSRLRKRG